MFFVFYLKINLKLIDIEIEIRMYVCMYNICILLDINVLFSWLLNDCMNKKYCIYKLYCFCCYIYVYELICKNVIYICFVCKR